MEAGNRVREREADREARSGREAGGGAKGICRPHADGKGL